MKIVSACLADINCRWDGKSKSCKKVIELIKEGKAIPICPEQLGGLSTPRDASEKKGKKVFTKEGKELTDEFEKGAEEALKIVKLINCEGAILKSKSPSCGVGKIYDGTFSGNLIKGNGIFAQKLIDAGIEVLTDEDFD